MNQRQTGDSGGIKAACGGRQLGGFTLGPTTLTDVQQHDTHEVESHEGSVSKNIVTGSTPGSAATITAIRTTA